MKLLTAFLLLASITVTGQNFRGIYEYIYKPDSTKMDTIKKEWMYLDISKDGSKFYSKKNFDEDSIVLESLKKQAASGSRSFSVSRYRGGSKVDFEVEKVYPEFQTFLTTGIGNDQYKVAEDRSLNWKISADKQKIGEWNAQKAETDFAGRKWIAWFTSEIPFQDGPYKFHGLPGLIVKIEDEEASHVMELKAFKNQTHKASEEFKGPDGMSVPLVKGKPVNVTRSQYLAKMEQYRADPVQGMREVLSRPNSKVKININGQEYSDPKDVLRMMEKQAKEEMARNNNPIELKP